VFPVHLQRSAVVAIVDCSDRGQFIGSLSLKQAALQWIWLFQEFLHGAMASIQGSTPALLCAHDERTHGLANEMAIPILIENNTSILEPLQKLEESYYLYLDKQVSPKTLLIDLIGQMIKT